MKVLLQVVTDYRSPVSLAIRFATRSWASHAEFVLPDGSTFGSHADGGVKARPYVADRYVRLERYTAPNIEDAYAWALTQAGKKYDFSAIAGIALDRNWRSGDRWFCSELIAAAWEHTPIPLLSPAADVSRITPRDLLLSKEITRADF